MTAQDFVNTRQNVIVRYASQGAPAGQDIALLDETELPFDLSEIEGEIDADGGFTATNLANESGACGWRFKDFAYNTIYGLWLRVDAKKWQAEYDDYMSA